MAEDQGGGPVWITEARSLRLTQGSHSIKEGSGGKDGVLAATNCAESLEFEMPVGHSCSSLSKV